MEVSSRDVDGVLLIRLEGPWPKSDEEWRRTANTIYEGVTAYPGRFVLVPPFRQFVPSRELGIFISLLERSGVVAAKDDQAPLPVVVESERVRSVLSVLRLPLEQFATEEEAVSSMRG